MDSEEFGSLFRDLITHLYDYSVLETHPLVQAVTPPNDFKGSRGEYLRRLVYEEIERFKPAGEETPPRALEWRAYNLLKGRYVDNLSLRSISQELALSERQLRRDNNRALQALTMRVWEALKDNLNKDQAALKVDEQEDQQAFDAQFERLDLVELIKGVTGILNKRISPEGYVLELIFNSDAVPVIADRIVTRQILINLVSYLLNFPCDETIYLEMQSTKESAVVHLWSRLTDPWTVEDENEHQELLASALYWTKRLNASLEESHPEQEESGEIHLRFRLPLAKQPVVLVVDDQKPTHRMFKRFLSRTPYQIVGTTDSSEAISLARKLRPVLITLDVMMPKMDGWELLQALKTNIETSDIPVLVCSAWEEPELAQSLGAAGFIKKPVRQQDLLAAMQQLKLSDKSA